MMNRLKKSLINNHHRLNGLAGALLRKKFPPFRWSGGRIKPPYGFWVNVVDHCNLSCQDCNHASPAVPECFADPAELQRDLTFLSNFYKPGVLILVGGEPMLHPDLGGILRAIRSSRICNYLILTTNGTLMNRMPEDTWSLLNQVDVSTYPEVPLPPEQLNLLAEKAKRHNVKLKAFYFEQFRIPFSLQGTSDENLRRRIFLTCKGVNLHGCHNYHQGYFYKCPQAIYTPTINGSRATHEPQEDAIRLESPGQFPSRLWDYLASRTPLKSCGFCLGSVGKSRPHRLAGPLDWHASHDFPAEELIDFEKLEAAERGVDHDIRKQLLLD